MSFIVTFRSFYFFSHFLKHYNLEIVSIKTYVILTKYQFIYWVSFYCKKSWKQYWKKTIMLKFIFSLWNTKIIKIIFFTISFLSNLLRIARLVPWAIFWFDLKFLIGLMWDLVLAFCWSTFWFCFVTLVSLTSLSKSIVVPLLIGFRFWLFDKIFPSIIKSICDPSSIPNSEATRFLINYQMKLK